MHAVFSCGTLTGQQIHISAKMCKMCLPKLSKKQNEPWANKWENSHSKMLQIECIPREQAFHITEYQQCEVFNFIPYMVPVILNTPSYVLSLKCVCIALKGTKVAVVLVLFPSLLLRNWFYWWLVHCLTPFTLSEVFRDQKFYRKLKKSCRWC